MGVYNSPLKNAQESKEEFHFKSITIMNPVTGGLKWCKMKKNDYECKCSIDYVDDQVFMSNRNNISLGIIIPSMWDLK